MLLPQHHLLTHTQGASAHADPKLAMDRSLFKHMTCNSLGGHTLSVQLNKIILLYCCHRCRLRCWVQRGVMQAPVPGM